MYHMDEFDCYRIYTHVSTSYEKKKPYKKQLYWQSPTPFSPVLINLFVNMYRYMNILFPQTLKLPLNKFSSHQCSVNYEPMICSFVVHLDYDGNDHFRERLQVDCVFFFYNGWPL